MRTSFTALVSTVALALTVALLPGAAVADDVVTSTVTSLVVPSQVTLRRPVTLTATVTGAGVPVTAGVVRFEQRTSTGWAAIGDDAVDAAGSSTASVTLRSATNDLRASYLGSDGHDPSSSPEARVTAVSQSTSVTLEAPRFVVDERTLRVAARVRTPFTAVAGATVAFQVYKGGRWRTYGTARTDGSGVATARSKPRASYQYRAVVTAADWYTGAKTATVKVRNTPPGTVVKLPRKAPRPCSLPAQPRATVAGAHARVSSISSSVWRSMTGRSWRAGCPVGRSRLRLVRVNYWGFDGYRHRGDLVVNRSIATKTARAFTDLYRHRVPIRAMYRIDRFGYSRRVHGADDHASMAADNTSAFNCRSVVGRAGVRSPHATGRAIDINPFENPYRYRYGRWVPNTWWHTHKAGTYAWTERSDLVPRIMRRNGFRWTYGNIDGQHFDG